MTSCPGQVDQPTGRGTPSSDDHGVEATGTAYTTMLSV